MKILLALLLALAFGASAPAREAPPVAANEAVEQHLIRLTSNLRCLVCQNESLAASQADLAKDLRAEVRGMIEQGKSDREITDYLVKRYGNFVLYKPPVEAATLPLWAGPFVLLALGVAALVLLVRRRAAAPDAPLDAEQAARAEALLNRPEDRS